MVSYTGRVLPTPVLHIGVGRFVYALAACQRSFLQSYTLSISPREKVISRGRKYLEVGEDVVKL